MKLTNKDLSVITRAESVETLAVTDTIECPTEDFRTDYTPLKPKLKEVEGDLNREVLKQELENYDIYLHNIHSGFKSASSVNALSRLVRDGLSVNRQRRAAIEHAINLKTVKTLNYHPITGEPTED